MGRSLGLLKKFRFGLLTNQWFARGLHASVSVELIRQRSKFLNQLRENSKTSVATCKKLRERERYYNFLKESSFFVVAWCQKGNLSGIWFRFLGEKVKWIVKRRQESCFQGFTSSMCSSSSVLALNLQKLPKIRRLDM